jgi:alkaline phosphatase D
MNLIRIGRCTLTSRLVILLIGIIPTAAHAQHEYKATRTLIRDGKLAEAVELLEKKIQQDPTDSEWVAQLAIAQARLGQTESAMENLKKAVAMDAPPERFVAEMQNLLKPVADSPEFQAWLKEQPRGIIHGPMLGALHDQGVQIWIRTAGPRDVRLQLIRQGAAANEPIRKTKKTGADSDYTAVFVIDRLVPDSEYCYQFDVKIGEDWEVGPKGTFRTLTPPGKPRKFSIAFGGGAGYVPQNERMWTTIEKFDPAALLLLGDNVYIDMPKSREMQRFCYYRRHARPEFRRLIKDRPVFTIWDDHDFGTNDCLGGAEIDNPPWKPEVWEVYRQNWVNPAYGGGKDRPGCWYEFQLGDVQFFMLDGRYYRTNPRQKPATMLGPDQKAWLKDRLKASQATFKVLVSPVPWDFRTKGDSLDTWNGFREERAELFSFLTENKIEGVFLMSADRHRSDAWKIDRENDYPLYEFESSRLTNLHRHGPMKEAIFSYSDSQSFGLVEFDTTAADPTVKYTVITIDGEPVESLTLKRSQLRTR